MLFAIAAAICAIPAALVPLAGRSAREFPPGAAIRDGAFAVSPIRTPRPPLTLRIARDPFVPDRLAAPRPPAVPDARSSAAQDCTAPSVRGVAVGSRPQAIVACGGRVQLVAPGDRLNGFTVTNITSSGIVLTGGAVLTLPEEAK